MGHRLSKIYTRTGDKGTTGLGDGTRVDKDDLRVETYGTIDELNSAIGMINPETLPANLSDPLRSIQNRLFDLGGELSIPGREIMIAQDPQDLEQTLDALNAQLAPLKEFIIPGGHPAASACHLARTICRRAERLMVRLHKTQRINPYSLMYLNRLSDLMFVMARSINQFFGYGDVLWEPREKL